MEKTVLITGASRGLGEQMAYEFSKRGSHTILIGRDLESLSRVSTNIRRLYAGSADILSTDLSGGDSAVEVKKLLLSEKRRIDIIVNNAAIQLRKEILQCEPGDYAAVFNTNFMSPFYLYKELNGLMNHNGFVVNIASKLGLKAKKAGYSLYSASKAALINLGDSLVIENNQICVMTFCLGAIMTDTFRKLSAGEANGRGLDPAVAAKMIVERIYLTEFSNTHILINE